MWILIGVVAIGFVALFWCGYWVAHFIYRACTRCRRTEIGSFNHKQLLKFPKAAAKSENIPISVVSVQAAPPAAPRDVETGQQTPSEEEYDDAPPRPVVVSGLQLNATFVPMLAMIHAFVLLHNVHTTQVLNPDESTINVAWKQEAVDEDADGKLNEENKKVNTSFIPMWTVPIHQ